jgi:hypothetical protein
MDAADIASELDQEFQEHAVKKVRQKAGIRMHAATGYCLYCNETVPDQQLFCSSDCRDDWEYEQMRNQINRKG